MRQITYQTLTAKNFGLHSLDYFIRRQDVKKCWRRVEGTLTLLPIAYIEDWDLTERRETAKEILEELQRGGFAYGALCEGKIVGFAVLAAALFGTRKRYMDLSLFYVSEPFRRMGIGKELFLLACQGAKNAGAEKLYISAHSAEDSMAAYRNLGCVEAMEVNRFLAEKEPCDVQLEYVIRPLTPPV